MPQAGEGGEARIVFPLAMVDLTTMERLKIEGEQRAQELALLERIPLWQTRLELPFTLPNGLHEREATASLVAEIAADLASQLPGLIASALGIVLEDEPAGCAHG